MKIRLILLTIVLLSCVNSNSERYDVFEIHEKDIVRKNKISQISKIEIGLDMDGQPLWERLSLTKFFDQQGNLIKEIIPKYLTRTYIEPPEGLSASEKWRFALNMNRTNIPIIGYGDTISYTYDTNGNLLTKKEGQLISRFKYDKYNNPILECFTYNETVCNTKKYEYKKNGQIVSRVDSFGVSSREKVGNRLLETSNGYKKKFDYIYDDNGRLIFDGERFRTFNKRGQLIQVKVFFSTEEYREGKKASRTYDFLYDDSGKRICEIFTRVVSSSGHTETTRKYFYYNEKGLLFQEKELNEDDILISLHNYTYTFY